MDLKLDGLKAVITGSTAGIGRAIAQTLCEEGAHVAICSRNQDKVDKTIEQFSQLPGKAVGGAVDVNDRPAFQNWVDAMASELGGIDIFVANVTGGAAADGKTPWEHACDTDIQGTVGGIDAALPMLKQSSHGSIIYISSIAGSVAMPEVPHYGAVKAAMNHYMKTLAKMLVRDGVRVNVVAPGDIMAEGNVWDRVSKERPDYFEKVLRRNPRGSLGTPEEIAQVVSFIASPMASLVNGANIIVDGCSTNHIH